MESPPAEPAPPPPAPAGPPANIPPEYAAVVDNPITGHIADAGLQERCVSFGNPDPATQEPFVSAVFQDLLQTFKNMNIIRPNAPGSFSFLYCPFIWRILARAKADGDAAVPEVPAQWLNYGPQFNLAGEAANFVNGVNPATMFSPGDTTTTWNDHVETALAAPGLAGHILAQFTAVRDAAAAAVAAAAAAEAEAGRVAAAAAEAEAGRVAAAEAARVAALAAAWRGPALPLSRYPMPQGTNPQMYAGVSARTVNEVIGQLSGGSLGLRPADVCFCPICLTVAPREDGCMYMSHLCDQTRVHPGLYSRYLAYNGEIGWCTLCGRVCKSVGLPHKHYVKNDIVINRGRAAQLDMNDGLDGRRRVGYFDRDCVPTGGGRAEKERRFQRLVYSACMAIPHIGRVPEWIVHISRIEYIWMADVEMELLPNGFQRIPCELPDPIVVRRLEGGPARDVQEPPGVLPPLRFAIDAQHQPAMQVLSDENDPIWQFRHNANAIHNHDGEYIGADDMYAGVMQRMGGVNGLCPLAPCRERIWPSEFVAAGIDAERVAEYRRELNELLRNQAGGGHKGIEFVAYSPPALASCAGRSKPPKGSSRPTRRHIRRLRATMRS
uniref:Uncharacterized protein n=1 Tax=viral metagenome TaxID=1070528 RepID=A0A6C0F3D4_9ZZZZ